MTSFDIRRGYWERMH